MKHSPRQLANLSSVGSKGGLKPAPMALLPPIPLYRRLFRAQRKYLPRRERLLGEEYIKKEFRAHRGIENPIHIVCLPPNCTIIVFEAVVFPDYHKLSSITFALDRILDRVANVCSDDRRQKLGRRNYGQGQD